MAKKLIDESIPKFLLVGVGNTLLSMALMFLLEGLGYWPSTAIAYVAGAVMSFFLNRHFTFHSRGDPGPLGGEVRRQRGGVLCAGLRPGPADRGRAAGP